jgi:hypothetical protein
VEGGRWKVESGELRVEGGKWKVDSGRWKVESGKWNEDRGEWRLKTPFILLQIIDNLSLILLQQTTKTPFTL